MSISTRLRRLERAVGPAPCPACSSIPDVFVSADGKDVPPETCPRCGVSRNRLVVVGIDVDRLYGPGGKAGWERTHRERGELGDAGAL